MGVASEACLGSSWGHRVGWVLRKDNTLLIAFGKFKWLKGGGEVVGGGSTSCRGEKGGGEGGGGEWRGGLVWRPSKEGSREGLKEEDISENKNKNK